MSPRYAFILRRLIMLPVSLFIISALIFALVRLVPGDAAQLMAGDRATAEQVEAIRSSMNLDQPVWVQYATYLSHLVQGDLGRTSNGGAAVADVIASNMEPTLWLAAGSIALTLVCSIVIAVLSSRKPGGVFDSIVRGSSALAFGMPLFWVGLMLLVFVAVPAGLPIGGWSDDPLGRVQRLILPCIAVAITLAPLLIRSLRTSLMEVRGSDYVTVGKALGLSGGQLVSRYILRNSLIPSVPLIALVLAYLLGGVVMVEATFGLPGLGLSLVQAAKNRDVNLIQGLTLVIALAVIVVNLLADILTAVLDPRVKIS